MRPRSIMLFEALSLAAVTIGVLILASSWNALLAAVHASVRGAGIEEAVIILSVLYIGLLLLLILLASRRRNAIAKWLFAAIIAAELLLSIPQLPGMLRAGAVGWAETLQLLIQLAAVAFLFVPASRAWFRERRAV